MNDTICLWKGQRVQDLTKEELIEALTDTGRELEHYRAECYALMQFKVDLMREVWR